MIVMSSDPTDEATSLSFEERLITETGHFLLYVHGAARESSGAQG